MDSGIYSDYTNLKMREWYRKNKQKCVDYKGGKCEKCGYCKSLNALDFHHTDPDEKDFQIGGSRRSWETVRSELDKCLLLCANCHREEHEKLIDEKHAQLSERVRAVVPERKRGEVKTFECSTCHKQFQRYVSQSHTYCSRKCRTKVQWPDNGTLQTMVNTTSVKEVAKILGATSKAVRERFVKQGLSWDKYRQNSQ